MLIYYSVYKCKRNVIQLTNLLALICSFCSSLIADQKLDTADHHHHAVAAAVGETERMGNSPGVELKPTVVKQQQQPAAAVVNKDKDKDSVASALAAEDNDPLKAKPKPSRRMSFKSSSSQPLPLLTGADAVQTQTGSISHAGGGGGGVTSDQHEEHKLMLAIERERFEREHEKCEREREKYERLMVQMVALNNDLNDREDQIIILKKREVAYEDQLRAKDKMYEQDAMVRMQLGKRLEQVLMDKEEITDELDMVRDQLETFKSLVNNQNQQKTAPKK